MRRPRVLIVDDERASQLVAASALHRLDVEVVSCYTAEAVLDEVANPPDAIVLDLMMPDVDGITLCRRLRAADATRDVPILMLTAHGGRDQKLLALDAGVDDFLTKPLDRMEFRTRIAAICRLNRYRRVLEDRRRLDSLVALSPNGVLVVEVASGLVRFVNPRASLLFGETVVGRSVSDVLGAAASATVQRISAAGSATAEMEPWTVDIGARTFSVAVGKIEWAGEPAAQVIVTDITALRQFEAEVHRIERMDTTVRLSASVAHDFATVLQVCLVHLRTLSAPTSPQQMEGAVAEMRHVIHRGRLITRDLLAFSRRGVERPEGICDAVAVVADLERLLRAILPLTIELVVSRPEGKWLVGIADYQLEQALVNLATNGRDAMTGAGVLTVDISPSSDAPGWVEVSVHDTGCGVDPRIQARLGEPFVSTKAEGQGTGLGLWSVKRVIEGAGGRWSFASTPGMGTTVRLHLPPAPVERGLRVI